MASRWQANPVGPVGVDSTDKDKNEGNSKENNDESKEKVATTRRPRCRPPGSKNKPKQPIFVTKDNPNVLRSHVMEIANGINIARSLLQFSERHQKGVCVLSATGIVTNITLHQHIVPNAVMALHGRFEIISLTKSFLPRPFQPGSIGLTVYLAGGQGEVVGGRVVGPLVASGPVMITATTFSNPAYERLPLPVEDNDQQGRGGGDSGGGGSRSGGGSSLGTRGGIGQQPGGEASSFRVYNLAPSNVPQLKQEAYSA